MNREGEESASFLKKRSKKLLVNWGMGGFADLGLGDQRGGMLKNFYPRISQIYADFVLICANLRNLRMNLIGRRAEVQGQVVPNLDCFASRECVRICTTLAMTGFLWAVGRAATADRVSKSFFASFFSKKEALAFV